MIKKHISLTLAVLMVGVMQPSEACTRVVYHGVNDTVLTARSMDWNVDIETNLWIFPRGLERDGKVGEKSVKWKSKYGSVIASGYEIATTDGMNEKGLSANLLWLAESEYTPWKGQKPGLTISAWTQYVLDNFATVKEAVDELRQEKFVVVSDQVPGVKGKMANLHLSISDSSGDSAIFEYIVGKLVIHHDKKYQTMTNSPIFDKQLALGEYWKEIGGTVMLPGTNRAADRFVRASFYINAIPKVESERVATASVFSVIRNVSVPYGISTPRHPNISSTRWRTVADHKNKIYYFESALTPSVFWVDMKKINFETLKSAKTLPLGKEQKNIFSGDTSGKFIEAKPFEFLGL